MKSKLAKPQPPLGDQEFADRVIAACEDGSGALLSILEKVREYNPHKYLPLEILEYIAEKTDIPALRPIRAVVHAQLLPSLGARPAAGMDCDPRAIRWMKKAPSGGPI